MINNIQALRALAAYLVVLVHCIEIPLGGGVTPMWGWGTAGVDIFFVISGYIMVYTTRSGTTPVHFIKNRLTRIAPLYWTITLAAFAVAVVTPSLMRSTTGSLQELIKSLLFIPYVKGSGIVQPVLFVGWTLNLEMFFYAIFAVSLTFGKRSIVVSSITLATLVILGIFVTAPVAKFLTQPMLLEFVAGMLIAHYRVILTRRAAYFALIAGLALLFASSAFYPEVDRALARLVPSTAILLAAVSLEAHGRSINSKAVLELGNASYALYLTHPFTTQLFIKVSKNVALPARLLAFCAALIAAGVIAVLVYRLFERPLGGVLKRWFIARPVDLSITSPPTPSAR